VPRFGQPFSISPCQIVNDWSKPLLQGGLGPDRLRKLVICWSLQRGHGFDLSTAARQASEKIQTLFFMVRRAKAGRRVSWHSCLPKTSCGRLQLGTYREFLLDYMSATQCPACHGKRGSGRKSGSKVNGMSMPISLHCQCRAHWLQRKASADGAGSTHRRAYRA